MSPGLIRIIGTSIVLAVMLFIITRGDQSLDFTKFISVIIGIVLLSVVVLMPEETLYFILNLFN